MPKKSLIKPKYAFLFRRKPALSSCFFIMLFLLLSTQTAALVQPAPTIPHNGPVQRAPEQDGLFSQELLRQDILQMVDLIEKVHPDPYINGGGKVAFYRRLHKLLEDIPADGMTKDEFWEIIRPFITAIKDSHTTIGLKLGTRNPSEYSGGIPLMFSIIERSLYSYGAQMKDNKLDDASEIFLLLAKFFPRSYISFDSLGEVFLRKGDKVKAKEYIIRWLGFNPENTNAKNRVEELK